MTMNKSLTKKINRKFHKAFPHFHVLDTSSDEADTT